MLNLHGCRQHSINFKYLGNWEEAAKTFHMTMIVVVPEFGANFANIQLK